MHGGFIMILIILFVTIFLIVFYLVKETGKRDELDDWLGMYGYFEAFENNSGVMNYTLTYENSELKSYWHALQKEYPVWCDSGEQMKGIYFTKRYSQNELED